MNPINLYSTLLLFLAVLAFLWSFMRRRGLNRQRVLVMVLVMVGILAVWWVVRPVQTPHQDASSLQAQIGAGKPVLLEFQSPY